MVPLVELISFINFVMKEVDGKSEYAIFMEQKTTMMNVNVFISEMF